jgi:hypothetical protein
MLQTKGYDVSITDQPLSRESWAAHHDLHAHETSGYAESDAIVCFVADGRFHLKVP